jgi:branched-chain amino acid transport system substrate-binding protein
VQGTGVDPACFSSSNISPVNTGPFQGITVSLQFASETIKRDKVCAGRVQSVVAFDLVGSVGQDSRRAQHVDLDRS